ncbi:MAG: glyceraldehyde-3-phosphate dehydrogenase, partial [Candidatus Aenigmatarchaeota archaeon]
MIKVAINGYGTVGKRVADAVALQKDMLVLGVVKTRPTFEARRAVEKGFPLYVNVKENIKAFEEAGIPVAGTAESLIRGCDIVVDASPDGIGIENKQKLYIPMRKKAIFQGGEKAATAEASFS